MLDTPVGRKIKDTLRPFRFYQWARSVKDRYYFSRMHPYPVYSVDWFTNNVEPWTKMLGHMKNKPVTFLEIGSYEGRATRWLLDNILTHPQAKIYCIDTLEGSMEHKQDSVDMYPVKRNFFHNIKPHRKKVKVMLNYSQYAIRENPTIFKENTFDMVYIDGSHTACDVLEDAILTFRTLKKEGVLIFDDYEWHRYEDPKLNPQLAINAWLKCFEGQYELLHKGYQLAVKKL